MRRRRAVTVFIISTFVLILLGGAMPRMAQEGAPLALRSKQNGSVYKGSAREALETVPVKGRAPKSGYARSEFGDGWAKINGCSTRDIILNRDLKNVVLNDECKVISGVLDDPYTGLQINFNKEEAALVQIDHVVALSDAWQKGAQLLSPEQRKKLANDPLELLAVDGPANQQKADGDAATWLPKNKSYRCPYVARQIAIKIKYNLWVTFAEKDAMVSVLANCPSQALP